MLQVRQAGYPHTLGGKLKSIISFWARFKSKEVVSASGVTRNLRLVKSDGVDEIVSLMPSVDDEQVKRTLSWQDFFDVSEDLGTRPTHADFQKFYRKLNDQEPDGAA